MPAPSSGTFVFLGPGSVPAHAGARMPLRTLSAYAPYMTNEAVGVAIWAALMLREQSAVDHVLASGGVERERFFGALGSWFTRQNIEGPDGVVRFLSNSANAPNAQATGSPATNLVILADELIWRVAGGAFPPPATATSGAVGEAFAAVNKAIGAMNGQPVEPPIVDLPVGPVNPPIHDPTKHFIDVVPPAVSEPPGVPLGGPESGGQGTGEAPPESGAGSDGGAATGASPGEDDWYWQAPSGGSPAYFEPGSHPEQTAQHNPVASPDDEPSDAPDDFSDLPADSEDDEPDEDEGGDDGEDADESGDGGIIAASPWLLLSELPGVLPVAALFALSALPGGLPLALDPLNLGARPWE